MKYLTDNEIKFLKETKFTPTIYQCDEWDRCSLKGLEDAELVAKRDYNVDFYEMLEKLLDGDDWISLEFAAGYLFYTFFTKDQLFEMSDKDGLKFLQDFKYHFGWRKADYQDARAGIIEGIKLHDKELVFVDWFDGDVWYKDNCELGEYYDGTDIQNSK